MLLLLLTLSLCKHLLINNSFYYIFTKQEFFINYLNSSTFISVSPSQSKHSIPQAFSFTSFLGNCFTQPQEFLFSVLSLLYFPQFTHSNARQSRGEGASQHLTQKNPFSNENQQKLPHTPHISSSELAHINSQVKLQTKHKECLSPVSPLYSSAPSLLVVCRIFFTETVSRILTEDDIQLISSLCLNLNNSIEFTVAAFVVLIPVFHQSIRISEYTKLQTLLLIFIQMRSD